jgi:hypothetical protein
MSYRTLTYRGMCIQGRVNPKTGREQFTIHNWASRPFDTLADAHRQIRTILFGR